MESADQEILGALTSAGFGEPAWLFTVAATWGSSPRPAGSMLLIDSEGRSTGSVSGGCVEEDLAERVRSRDLEADGPRIISYGVTRDEAHRFGLPCGGRLDLLVERVGDAGQWRILRDAVERREALVRRVCLRTGEVSLHPAGDEPGFRFKAGHHLTRVFGPRWQLLIIGANQISSFLAPIARSLGYRVIVCDPRDDEARWWGSQDADLVPGMPDDVVRSKAEDPRSAVVALTHDPKLDDMALMEALTSRAFYVGALGSRLSTERRLERLRTLGLTDLDLGRLRGPIGLPIGGRTPPEIAVSIAAELTACRHGRRLSLVRQEAGDR